MSLREDQALKNTQSQYMRIQVMNVKNGVTKQQHKQIFEDISNIYMVKDGGKRVINVFLKHKLHQVLKVT